MRSQELGDGTAGTEAGHCQGLLGFYLDPLDGDDSTERARIGTGPAGSEAVSFRCRGTIVAMITDLVRTARGRFSEYVDRVELHPERVVVMRNGHREAALIRVAERAVPAGDDREELGKREGRLSRLLERLASNPVHAEGCGLTCSPCRSAGIVDVGDPPVVTTDEPYATSSDALKGPTR